MPGKWYFGPDFDWRPVLWSDLETHGGTGKGDWMGGLGGVVFRYVVAFVALLLVGCAASPQWSPCSYEAGCNPVGNPCVNECPSGFVCRRFADLSRRDAVPGRQQGYCTTPCAPVPVPEVVDECAGSGSRLQPGTCDREGSCFPAYGCSTENECPAGTTCGGDGWCEPPP